MDKPKTNLQNSWARRDDCDAIIPLLRELYNHDVPEADEPTLGDIQTHIALLTDDNTPHRLAIAWRGENLAVGLAAVAVFASVSDPRPDFWRQAELKELFVLPDFRGDRIGAALLSWIEERATEMGACRMDWHVRSDNTRGISFYEAWGGTIVSNRVSMRKRLTNSGSET